jgi:hypothetical protein
MHQERRALNGKDLARKPSCGLQEFLDRAEEFVNQEETLQAFQEVEGIEI